MGSRYYGWYPMARYVDMTVTPTADGFRDDGAHRAAHAPVYRAYTSTDRDAFYEAGADAEDRHALLRGLFLTGWLAEDFFADNDWFGARRVLVLSASSKTALAFAHCADNRPGIEVIGVTSSRNHAFTHSLGCYDEVVAYDEIARIRGLRPSSRSTWRAAVRYSLRCTSTSVTTQALDGDRSQPSRRRAARAMALPGPAAFFFAPTQVKKRVQDWGARGYQQRVVTALSGFVDWSRTWLRVRHAQGAAAATATWREVHGGRTAAEIGHVVSLWD